MSYPPPEDDSWIKIGIVIGLPLLMFGAMITMIIVNRPTQADHDKAFTECLKKHTEYPPGTEPADYTKAWSYWQAYCQGQNPSAKVKP